VTALRKYGKWIQGRLEHELENPESLESRRHLQDLLDRLKADGSLSLVQERLRARRTLEVLEQTGTPEARKVLQRLAEGAPEEDLRKEAQATLTRLAKSP
jgi:hypothetical protein